MEVSGQLRGPAALPPGKEPLVPHIYIKLKIKLPVAVDVQMYRAGNKTEYSNDRRISVLPTTFKIVSTILVSRLTP
jgi:hypothetical protein